MPQLVLGEQKSFFLDIFGWWYSKGLRDFFVYLKAILIKISDIFSVKILLRTFLSPWKRDVVSSEGLPLNLIIKVVILNLVSRLFGALIKTIILLLYLLVVAVFFGFSLLLLSVWIFLPLITIGGIIIGLGLIISG